MDEITDPKEARERIPILNRLLTALEAIESNAGGTARELNTRRNWPEEAQGIALELTGIKEKAHALHERATKALQHYRDQLPVTDERGSSASWSEVADQHP